MAGALILTIIPVMLIVAVLLLSMGGLSPLAVVGFASLLGLVVIVFVGLLRSARRMQPSKHRGEPTGIAARSTRDEENSIGAWDDEGGSPGREVRP